MPECVSLCVCIEAWAGCMHTVYLGSPCLTPSLHYAQSVSLHGARCASSHTNSTLNECNGLNAYFQEALPGEWVVVGKNMMDLGNGIGKGRENTMSMHIQGTYNG